MPAPFRMRFANIALSLATALAGCASVAPELAPVVAQPRTAPMRNFTSFDDALRCMDGLLARSGYGPVRISSTGIPDKTKKVNVGGDEMLVNAINQMNRHSRAYAFIDQPLEKKDGQIVYLTKRDEDPEPRFYIRGAISQLDTGVVGDSADLVALNTLAPERPVRRAALGRSRDISVVTVDLHLAAYPSRIVQPGGSVANSMVVISDGASGGVSGLIDLTSLDLTIRMDRIESLGQAVRNLVELGAIELLGRHAGVPYWTCLSTPSDKAERNGRGEKVFATKMTAARVAEVQRHLARLGYLIGTPTGRIDPATRRGIARFQSDEKLIASGEVDWDLIRRLREKVEIAKARVNATTALVRLQKEQAPKRKVPTPTSATSMDSARDVAKTVGGSAMVKPAAQPAAMARAATAAKVAPKPTPSAPCPAGTSLTPGGCLSDLEILSAYMNSQ